MPSPLPRQIAFRQRSPKFKEHFLEIRAIEKILRQALQEGNVITSEKRIEEIKVLIQDISLVGYWQVKPIIFHSKKALFFEKFHIQPFKKDTAFGFLNKLKWVEFIEKKWLKSLPIGSYVAVWRGNGGFCSDLSSNFRYMWEIKQNQNGRRFVTEYENATDEKRKYDFRKTVMVNRPLD